MWDDVWPRVENTQAFLNSDCTQKRSCKENLVFLFQDIFHVWLSVNNFAVCYMAFVSCGFFLGVWIKMSRERSCWNQNGFMVTWLVIYVCLHILHPYRKNKLHKEVVDYSTDRPLTHLSLTINLISTFCTQFQIKPFSTQKTSTFCTIWDKLTCSQPMSVLKYGCSSILIIPLIHSELNQNYDAR